MILPKIILLKVLSKVYIREKRIISRRKIRSGISDQKGYPIPALENARGAQALDSLRLLLQTGEEP